MKLYFFSVAICFAILGNTQGSLSLKTEEIEHWLRENKVQALGVGIIKNGVLKRVQVYGKTCKGTAAPTNVVFNVASLTKPIVAVLTLRLVNAGLWSLDEPVATYWTDPDVAADPRAGLLTTRQLLSHQSGFPNWRWNGPDKKLAFQFDPGTKFQYSGEGYEYLRKALERKFHLSLEQLADSFLLKPLHMASTTFLSAKPALPTVFCQEGITTDSLPKSANAADDLLTTVEDYANFGISVLNKQGLSEDLYADMIKPHTKIKDKGFMSLGWEILPGLKDDEFALLHTGSDIDAGTLIILLPRTKEGLVIFTNSQEGFKLYPALITSCLSRGQEIMDRAK